MKASENGGSRWQPVWLLMIVSLLVMGFMVWNVMVVQNGILKQTEKIYLREQTQNITAVLGEVGQQAEKMAMQIAAQDQLMKAVEQNDNDVLADKLVPLYRQWKQNQGVTELSLVSAAGEAVWSSLNGVEPGNDLSYQRTTSQSLHQQKSVAAMEAAERETMLVVTWPLFMQDEYLGLCRVGISLSYLGEQLQQRQPGQVALFNLNGIDSQLLWENQKGWSALNTNDIKKLQDGETISRPFDWYTRLLVVPLQDIDRMTVAYIQNQLSLQGFVQARLFNYLMLLLALLLICLTNYAYGRSRYYAEDDLSNSLARISKINNVAFQVHPDNSRKNSPDE
ncbi:MAG TPA: cache domain-containing protein [Syntrophomonas sp.]|nr:cache domain-containing protein [Syntrophomonas sp.]